MTKIGISYRNILSGEGDVDAANSQLRDDDENVEEPFGRGSEASRRLGAYDERALQRIAETVDHRVFRRRRLYLIHLLHLLHLLHLINLLHLLYLIHLLHLFHLLYLHHLLHLIHAKD